VVGREKEFDSKAAEVRERRTKLAEYLKEFVDGLAVFYEFCVWRADHILQRLRPPLS